MSKILITIFTVGIILVSFTVSAYAITLLTEREAMKMIFPERDDLGREEIMLSVQEVGIIKSRLQGEFVHHKKGRKADQLKNKRDFVIYYAKKNREIIGYGIVLEEPGKWGPIKYIITIDSDFKLNTISVMSYTETRGRPIARRSFLRQFTGKKSKDRFRLRDDIIAIAGATISSQATAFTAKKALVMIEELCKVRGIGEK